MALITEKKLRELVCGSSIKVFELEEGDIITPQAKEYLNDLKIKLIKKGWYCVKVGSSPGEKPEDKTHLRRSAIEFISKEDPVIIFRGKLDSLESEMLLVQLRFKSLGRSVLVDILRKTLDFVRNIMKSEVKEIPFDSWGLLGMQSQEIREMSHDPNRHFGFKHIVPELSMGEEILLLNKLRSLTRETEISAVKAFSGSRIDLIEVLNRLSSFFYVCMLKIFSEGAK